MNKLNDWSNQTGFKFSTSKTQCILFKNKISSINTQPPILSLNNVNLQYSDTLRYLGMIIDQRLNWVQHFKTLKSSCNQRLSILKYIANHGWGSDQSTLSTVYKAFIRSKLEYGAVAYSSSKPSSQNIIRAQFNTGLRLSIGAYHTSPTLSLYVEAGELPPTERQKLIISKYCIKVLLNNSHMHFKNICTPHLLYSYTQNSSNASPFYIRFHKTVNEMHTSIKWLLPYPLTEVAPWNNVKLKTDLTLKKLVKEKTHPVIYHQNLHQILQSFPDRSHIFTDGSKTANGTGAAFTSSGTNMSFTLNNYNSIYTAELYAIKEALKYAISSNANKYMILTDSFSAIQGLSKLLDENSIIVEINNLLFVLSNQNKDICFVWIPSHVGIQGNERVDELARLAANTSSDCHTLTSSDFTNMIKQKLLCSWSTEWLQNTTQNKLRKNKNHIKTYNRPLQRLQQRAITRILIGHSKITHSHLLNREEPPVCSLCNTQITIEHILYDCHKYNNHRQQYQIANLQHRGDKTDVQTIHRLLKFIESINIINSL